MRIQFTSKNFTAIHLYAITALTTVHTGKLTDYISLECCQVCGRKQGTEKLHFMYTRLNSELHGKGIMFIATLLEKLLLIEYFIRETHLSKEIQICFSLQC